MAVGTAAAAAWGCAAVAAAVAAAVEAGSAGALREHEQHTVPVALSAARGGVPSHGELQALLAFAIGVPLAAFRARLLLFGRRRLLALALPMAFWIFCCTRTVPAFFASLLIPCAAAAGSTGIGVGRSASPVARVAAATSCCFTCRWHWSQSAFSGIAEQLLPHRTERPRRGRWRRRRCGGRNIPVPEALQSAAGTARSPAGTEVPNAALVPASSAR